MIISKTPVRISLFGGGTDYPAYYENNPAAVLGTTIDKYIYISVHPLQHFFDYKLRVGYSKVELVNSVNEIQHPSVRECLKFFGIDEGIDIHIFAELPARTGLGSSSSFTVGFIHALKEFMRHKASKEILAKESLFVEQQLIKEKVGSQDQYHAAYGGLNEIIFSKENIECLPIDIEEDRKNLLDRSLMLFYTGIKRYAEDILDEQIKKTKSLKNNEYLKEMYALVKEAKNLLVEASDFQFEKAFGELMHESWQLKCKLSSQITSAYIDSLYTKARDAGALGGKLCGAGRGGFLLLFVPKESQENVRKALHPLMEIDFNFEDQGSTILYHNLKRKKELVNV